MSIDLTTQKPVGSDISPEHLEFRLRLREKLLTNLPSDWRGVGALTESERVEFMPKWREFLIAERLIAPGVPEHLGGGNLSSIEQSIVAEELIRIGAPSLTHPCDNVGFKLLIPTLIHSGTPEQQERFIPQTLQGDVRWAQGYSEPEAGSDLFSLRTTAVRDGDEWIINGQKIWQTAGTLANWLFALVVTHPEERTSQRLSFLLIPLDQPGVEVRGIRNTVGDEEFAEVFFTNARTHISNTVGEPGSGAQVALTLLGFERGSGGVANALADRLELERLATLIVAQQRDNDPHIRQRLAQCYASIRVLNCIAQSALATGAAGAAPGPESSILKLLTAEHRQAVTELAMDVLGRDALVFEGSGTVDPLKAQPVGVDALSSRTWVTDFLQARPATVYGGSSQIQRSTIGERVLGLPREPKFTPQRSGEQR